MNGKKLSPQALDPEAGCACFSIRRAARAIAQVYDHHLQPMGIKNTQFSLLAALSIKGPISVNALADVMAMDRTTLTRNLGVLDRRGLVDVKAGKDARTKAVELSKAGLSLFKKATPLWQSAQSTVLSQFGQSHWNDFQHQLSDMEQLARTLR